MRGSPCEKSNELVVSIIILSVILLGSAIFIALEVPVHEVQSMIKSSPNDAAQQSFLLTHSLIPYLLLFRVYRSIRRFPFWMYHEFQVLLDVLDLVSRLQVYVLHL